MRLNKKHSLSGTVVSFQDTSPDAAGKRHRTQHWSNAMSDATFNDFKSSFSLEPSTCANSLPPLPPTPPMSPVGGSNQFSWPQPRPPSPGTPEFICRDMRTTKIRKRANKRRLATASDPELRQVEVLFERFVMKDDSASEFASPTVLPSTPTSNLDVEVDPWTEIPIANHARPSSTASPVDVARSAEQKTLPLEARRPPRLKLGANDISLDSYVHRLGEKTKPRSREEVLFNRDVVSTEGPAQLESHLSIDDGDQNFGSLRLNSPPPPTESLFDASSASLLSNTAFSSRTPNFLSEFSSPYASVFAPSALVSPVPSSLGQYPGSLAVPSPRPRLTIDTGSTEARSPFLSSLSLPPSIAAAPAPTPGTTGHRGKGKRNRKDSDMIESPPTVLRRGSASSSSNSIQASKASALTSGMADSSSPGGEDDEEEEEEEEYEMSIWGAGMMELCRELGVSTDDWITLALAWKWDCKTGGKFFKAEFVAGMRKMGCRSLSDLRLVLVALRKELADEKQDSASDTFKQFYAWTFDFARQSSAYANNRRTIGVVAVRHLLRTLLAPRYPVHIFNFDMYLRHLSSIAAQAATSAAIPPPHGSGFRMSTDQWMMFLEFCRSVDAQSLAGYSPDGPWPVMIDEYVEWLTTRSSVASQFGQYLKDREAQTAEAFKLHMNIRTPPHLARPSAPTQTIQRMREDDENIHSLTSDSEDGMDSPENASGRRHFPLTPPSLSDTPTGAPDVSEDDIVLARRQLRQPVHGFWGSGRNMTVFDGFT